MKAVQGTTECSVFWLECTLTACYETAGALLQSFVVLVFVTNMQRDDNLSKTYGTFSIYAISDSGRGEALV